MTPDVIDRFELAFTREGEIALARNILATVPEDYTEDQLADVGKRARHWVMQAWRLYASRSW